MKKKEKGYMSVRIIGEKSRVMLRVETYSRVIAEVADGGGWWRMVACAQDGSSLS